MVQAPGAGRGSPRQADDVNLVVGGISPIGQKRSLPTVLDRTAMDHATIFISGGRRGLDVEMAPEDLIRLTKARVERIGRGA